MSLLPFWVIDELILLFILLRYCDISLELFIVIVGVGLILIVSKLSVFAFNRKLELLCIFDNTFIGNNSLFISKANV